MTLPLPDMAIFHERSPYEADCGNLIGRHPRQIPLADIRRLQHPESPVKAIRAKCLDCVGNNVAEVRKCVSANCALWPYRMGANPFHASSTSAKREGANIATSSGSEADQ